MLSTAKIKETSTVFAPSVQHTELQYGDPKPMY